MNEDAVTSEGLRAWVDAQRAAARARRDELRVLFVHPDEFDAVIEFFANDPTVVVKAYGS